MPEFQRWLTPTPIVEDLQVAVNDAIWEEFDHHQGTIVCNCGFSPTGDVRKHAMEMERHQIGKIINAVQHEITAYLEPG